MSKEQTGRPEDRKTGRPGTGDASEETKKGDRGRIGDGAVQMEEKMKWQFENGIPIYLQILRKMRTEIASGAYPPGGKLPPVRELALEAGVNPNTMQRAFAELERDGLVFSQRTSGRFVTEDEEALRQIRRSLSEEIINELCTRLTHLGMDREEIRAAVDAWVSGNFLSAESEKETKPERELSPENEIKPKES